MDFHHEDRGGRAQLRRVAARELAGISDELIARDDLHRERQSRFVAASECRRPDRDRFEGAFQIKQIELAPLARTPVHLAADIAGAKQGQRVLLGRIRRREDAPQLKEPHALRPGACVSLQHPEQAWQQARAQRHMIFAQRVPQLDGADRELLGLPRDQRRRARFRKPAGAATSLSRPPSTTPDRAL